MSWKVGAWRIVVAGPFSPEVKGAAETRGATGVSMRPIRFPGRTGSRDG